MENIRDFKIAIGSSRKSTSWQTACMSWKEFTDRLKTPIRGQETLEEYLRLPKTEQDARKDVGGFVGGEIGGDGRRKQANVLSRSLITLDLDNIPPYKTEEALKAVGDLHAAAVVYSTRKHRDAAPRLRVVFPTDRDMKPDEVEPVQRSIAAAISIAWCDPTTFDINRLMYWPNCSRDGEYVYRVYGGDPIVVDTVLSGYSDWHDVSSWPVAPGEDALVRRGIAQQTDPLTKRGIVGAFCRTYTIEQAIDKFLPGLYTPAGDNRYTYTGGTTTGGAIVYDDGRYLYSHHATDPCGGKEVNAFDLVRLHKFGNQDAEVEDNTPINRYPSYLAMEDLAMEDPDVKLLLTKERIAEAQAAFSDAPEAAPPDAAADPEEDQDAWKSKLMIDKSGNVRNLVKNIETILENDPRLKGRILTDAFANRGLLIRPVPWDSGEGVRTWNDVDDSGCFSYLEATYGLPSKAKVLDALAVISYRHAINAVKKYLEELVWDKTPRVDMLLPAYLGAEDTVYTRGVMRKSLTAAVRRAVEEGTVKWDYMPILVGAQGIGKSTFLSILGKKWFSDSLTTFEGKEAAEMIQGTWINEVGELAAMTRNDVEHVKQFLSKQTDIYREAYGRRTKEFARHCVFFGTTNRFEVLKDSTGNRRFWPVDVGVHPAIKSVWDDLPAEVDQIWAEVYYKYKHPEIFGVEDLYPTGEFARIAESLQRAHEEDHPNEGIILGFLDTEVPGNWQLLSIQERRMFLEGNFPLGECEEGRPLDRVCAMEIWVECLGRDQRYMKNSDAQWINSVLSKAEGWQRTEGSIRFGPYKKQRGFIRKR